MAIDNPVSDTDRAIQHDPDQSWPRTLKIQLMWEVDGKPVVRTETITADQFFGRASFGAPMDGSAVIGMIENMRRAGPPPVERPRKITGKQK